MVKHHREAAEAKQKFILFYHRRLDIPEQGVRQAGQKSPLSLALLVSFKIISRRTGPVPISSSKVTSHTELAND